MKLKGFLAMMMAASVMVGFTACEDDDNDPELIIDPVEEPDLAALVEGSYTGYALYGSRYFSNMLYASQTVTITRHGDEKAKVDVTLADATLGTYTFTDVEVVSPAEAEGVATLTAEGSTTIAGHGAAEPTVYAATLEATITSADEFVFTLGTPEVMGGSTLVIQAGEAPAAQYAAGEYAGYGLYGSAYFSNMLYLDKTVKVEAVEGSLSKVNVTLEDAALGNYTFAEADVTVDAGTFTITGTGSASMDNHQGGTSDYAATLSATISPRGFTFTLGTPEVMGGSTLVIKSGDVPYAYGVATSKKGTSIAQSPYFTDYVVEGETATLTVTANADNLQAVDITYTSTTWGTITIEAAEVVYADGIYTVTGAGNCAMPSMRDPSAVTDYECTVKGTVEGSTHTWTFSVPGVMQGTDITFVPAASSGRPQ